MLEKENRLNKIAWAAVLLYFVETSVDGTGRIIQFGFISIQMVLFTIAFIATLPLVIKNLKSILSNPCVAMVLLFSVFAVFSAVLGFSRGNKIQYIRTDVTSILGLALLPGTISAMKDSSKLSKAVDILFWVASAFSLAVTVIYCFYPYVRETTMDALNAVYSAQLFDDEINRNFAYFRVNALMIFFSVYGVFKLKNAKERVWFLYVVEAALIMLILLSTERSSCLGLLVALLIVLAIKPKDIKHYLKSGIITTAVICAFIGIASLTRGEAALIPTLFGKFGATEVGNSFSYDEYIDENLKKPDQEKSTSISEEFFNNPEYPADREKVLNAVGSDNFRKITIQRHEYFINKSFPIGTGLGFDLYLSNGGKSEYMYLDFLMKMGIGFIAFLAAFFTPVAMCLKRILSELRTPNSELVSGDCSLSPETLSLFAGYIGIAVTSYFEPYLTNPMGIMILCLLAASVSIEINNDKQKQTTTESD